MMTNDFVPTPGNLPTDMLSLIRFWNALFSSIDEYYQEPCCLESLLKTENYPELLQAKIDFVKNVRLAQSEILFTALSSIAQMLNLIDPSSTDDPTNKAESRIAGIHVKIIKHPLYSILPIELKQRTIVLLKRHYPSVLEEVEPEMIIR